MGNYPIQIKYLNGYFKVVIEAGQGFTKEKTHFRIFQYYRVFNSAIKHNTIKNFLNIQKGKLTQKLNVIITKFKSKHLTLNLIDI